MRVQYLSRVFRWPQSSILILGLFLLSCAAQSSFRLGDEAQELLNRATQFEPASPDVERARIAYEAGSANLKEARFGRATQNFQESERYSRKILAVKNPQFKADYQTKESQAKEVGLEKPNWGPDAEHSNLADRMKLPAQALADYLAEKHEQLGKKKGDSSGKTKTKEKQKKTKKTETKKKQTEKKEKAAQMNKNDEGMKQGKAAKASDKVKHVDVVKASAEPKEKNPPKEKVKEKPKEKVKKDSKEKVAQNNSTGRNWPHREKLPGNLSFKKQDDSLTDSTMAELDKLSRHLVENPSNTLLLVGVVASGEGLNLIDRRFESVKTYLTGRGVPDDQVRLDVQRKSGKKAEFELYIIEH